MKKLVINNSVRKNRFLKDEMTQLELANELGVSRQTIVAIEKGKYSPSLELAFKLSKAFNIRIDDLFFLGEINESI